MRETRVREGAGGRAARDARVAANPVGAQVSVLLVGRAATYRGPLGELLGEGWQVGGVLDHAPDIVVVPSADLPDADALRWHHRRVDIVVVGTGAPHRGHSGAEAARYLEAGAAAYVDPGVAPEVLAAQLVSVARRRIQQAAQQPA